MAISDNADCRPDLTPIFVREKAAFVEMHRRHRGTVLDPIYFVDFVYQFQLIRREDFLEMGGFREGSIGARVS